MQINRLNQHKIAAILVVAIILVAGGIVAAGRIISDSLPKVSTTQSDSSSSDLKVGQSFAVNTQDDQQQSTPPKPTTLLDVSGSSSGQTKSFTTSGNWTLKYTYDCSNIGSKGIFGYDINDAMTNKLTTDIGANEYGMTGGTTNYYYDTGTFYVSVNSSCSWHITVVQ